MAAPERELTFTSQYMNHTSGTKHYALFTLEDKSRGSAVGIQVWGETGRVSGTKFVTGTAYQVEQQQLQKRNEKERSRNGGKYGCGVSGKVDYPVSQATAALKASLIRLGAEQRRADEITWEAMSKFGVSYTQAVEAQVEEVKAKTKEERTAAGADYNGSWGAW